MDKRKSKLAEYAATFCCNLAVVGIGVALFSEKSAILAASIALVVLVAGGVILWRWNNVA